jgi:uncharacterized protein
LTMFRSGALLLNRSAVRCNLTALASRRGLKSLIGTSAADLNCPSDELTDMGFRAGAFEPGTCALRGRVISDANGAKTGIWECSPGTFEFPNRPNLESIVILKGKVKLTNMVDNTSMTLVTGDAAVLECGSSVRWDVLETTRKFYVIAPEKMTM